MSSVNHDDFAHLKIPLESILSATNNFDEANIHGDGGFGNHYAGQLLWSGELINISARRLYKKSVDEKEQEFWMEISMLSSLKHKNLETLVGFCDENDEKVIIIRREINGSLENYLSYSTFFTWVQRLEICVGLAHALSYIHYDEHRDFSVIHRNIDSEMVLLNDNWEPKLPEFRLSMKIKASERHHSFHVDKVCDRDGYTDPKYIETKSVSHKSDIYSFGIVMFELLCGRKSVIADDTNKYLAPMAITRYREKRLEDIIDWDLRQQMDSESFRIFAETAYDCLNEERSQRPNIDDIVPKLEKAFKLACENRAIMSLPSNQFAHLKVPLEGILDATNNFAEENAIIEYDFSMEYKGQLLWSGELIDITAKRFNKERIDREQLFWTEISMLSSLKHKNLVSLVGFCDDNDEKIIIIRNEKARGMLKDYISDPILLTWVRRLEICVGLAHALSYIHYDEPREYSVIHRHIDSSRVILNDEWEPKLSHFEYSMKIKASQRHHSFHTNRLKYVTGNETRGMLKDYLGDPILLTWVRRLEICVGLAHALSYIHYDELREFSVIHRTLDSSRVFLNDDWEPKLYCFEDSMKIKASQRHHSFHTNRLNYVTGYGDPTYIETERVSHKSDMYSFGIIMFELMCGRESIIDSDTNKYLAPLAFTHYREKRLDEIIDWDVRKQMDSQSFNIFAETAYDCLNEERLRRPNIDEIITRLEKALEHQNARNKKYSSNNRTRFARKCKKEIEHYSEISKGMNIILVNGDHS
nr:protein kinase-like domain, phloem protein 2-like protein [Tanacetum cinerariifolium]